MKRVAMRELQRKLPDIIEELSASGEPLVVTQGNDPKAILVRFGDYDALNQQAVQGHPYISSNPGISRGEPIIRGTRITIQHVVERIQAGQTVEGILLDLQHLTPAQVHDALSYYYDHRSEIDELIVESQPDRVLGRLGMVGEKIADGVAIVHRGKE